MTEHTMTLAVRGWETISPETFLSTSNAKRRPPGRPPVSQPKRRRLNPRERPTRLSIRRSVVTQIHSDLWDLIFSWCDPGTLFSLSRVCKSFHTILMKDHSTVWIKALRIKHGQDIPSIPVGLIGPQYADLIENLGCMSCHKPTTRRTCWLWQRRWCKDCVKAKTISSSSLIHLAERFPGLLDCVRRGKVDNFGRYERVWNADEDGPDNRTRSLYLKSEISAFLTEWERQRSLVAAHPGPESVENFEKWKASKQAEVEGQMAHVREIEVFFEFAAAPESTAQEMKYLRRVFYRNKASEMDPPLNEDALSIIDAYRRAISVNRKPTERSWQILRPKLEMARAAAEAQVEDLHVVRELTRRMDYPGIARRRKETPSAGTAFLLVLAADMLEDSREELDGIHPADVIQIALQKVWLLYDAIPAEERPRATHDDLRDPDGSYRPSLDDAMLLYKRISEHLGRKWSRVEQREARLFKCPGCTSKIHNKGWRVRNLFLHLREKHASQLNSPWKEYGRICSEFGVGPREFPWALIEWPLNLPMLALNQKADGTWDPHDTTPLQQRKREGSCSIGRTTRLLSNRVALKEDVLDMRKGGLAGSVAFADKVLKDVNLEAPYKTLIAWKFAIDRHEACEQSVFLNDDLRHAPALSALSTDLLRMPNACTILDNLRCYLCVESYMPVGSLSYATHSHDIHQLTVHFRNRHAANYFAGRWKTEMLYLPSEDRLAAALAKAGPGARNAVDILFPLGRQDDV